MDRVGGSERKDVVGVLTQGKELAYQLKNHLHPTPTSRDACDSLLDKILSSYEKALKLMPLLQTPPPPPPPSPNSTCNRKRKNKWSEQVRLCAAPAPAPGFDPLDGYNWRKYGQKDILGSHHPRAYYRCTHRNTQGCLATKQVQRADDDPSFLVIVYKGKHSCMQERIQHKKQTTVLVPKKEDEMMISTGLGLKAELSTKLEDHFPCFSLPSSPVDEYENVETKLFSDHMGSPPFPSPPTSDSCFLLPEFDFAHSFKSSELDFAEIIYYPTPVTNIQLQIADLTSLDLDLDTIDCFQ